MDQERGYWDVVTAIAAVAAFIISILALVEASDDGAPQTNSPEAVARAPETEPREAEEPVPAALSSGDASEIRAELREFEITLSPTAAPGPVVVEVANEGAIVHNLVLEDGDARTPDLEAGESARMELGELEAGEYVLFCDIPGHRQAGMETTLIVDAS